MQNFLMIAFKTKMQMKKPELNFHEAAAAKCREPESTEAITELMMRI